MGIWKRTFFTRTAFAYFYSDFTNKNSKKWFEKGENFTETSCRSMEAVSTMKLPLKKAGELHNTTTLQLQIYLLVSPSRSSVNWGIHYVRIFQNMLKLNWVALVISYPYQQIPLFHNTFCSSSNLLENLQKNSLH